MRGYHCAISKSTLSRPIRSDPCSGTLKEYLIEIVAFPPAAGREGCGKIETHHGIIDPRPHGCPVHLHIRQVVAALKSAHAPARVRGKERGSFASIPVEILVDLNPDISKGIGRIIGISDLHRPCELRRGGVERCSYRVVRSLLPVVRTRDTARRAVAIRAGPVDPVGGRKGIIALGIENSARRYGSRRWRLYSHRRENDRVLLRAPGKRSKQEGVFLHVLRAVVLRNS